MVNGALLNIWDAARRLGIAPATLRAWTRERRNLAVVRVGRRVLIAEADIDAYLARQRVLPAVVDLPRGRARRVPGGAAAPPREDDRGGRP